MAINRRKTVGIDFTGNYQLTANASADYLVQTPTGIYYSFYIDINYDPVWRKSTDRGMTWGSATAFKNCTCYGMAVWADWWSGITATAYIHVVYYESDADDVFYRYLDTATDGFGTERTVFSGSSAASGGSISITRARGGNLICMACIDAGAEYDTVKSTDLFVNKTSINEAFEGATQDMAVLAPGWAADNQDVMCFYWDVSADELSVKYYDDSGDSWSEQSLATSMVEKVGSVPSVAVDTANSQNLVAAWSGVDTANADLRIWKVTEAANRFTSGCCFITFNEVRMIILICCFDLPNFLPVSLNVIPIPNLNHIISLLISFNGSVIISNIFFISPEYNSSETIFLSISAISESQNR